MTHLSAEIFKEGLPQGSPEGVIENCSKCTLLALALLHHANGVDIAKVTCLENPNRSGRTMIAAGNSFHTADVPAYACRALDSNLSLTSSQVVPSDLITVS